jgi:peptidoglycan/LPS O-acetylase OafA/YrhL
MITADDNKGEVSGRAGGALAPQSAGGRLTPLDGLRGFASLYVIVAHLCPPLLGRAIPIRILGAIIDFGWSGVDLFFVLSGFLITGILLKSKVAHRRDTSASSTGDGSCGFFRFIILCSPSCC